eukprot:UN03519
MNNININNTTNNNTSSNTQQQQQTGIITNNIDIGLTEQHQMILKQYNIPTTYKSQQQQQVSSILSINKPSNNQNTSINNNNNNNNNSNSNSNSNTQTTTTNTKSGFILQLPTLHNPDDLFGCI